MTSAVSFNTKTKYCIPMYRALHVQVWGNRSGMMCSAVAVWFMYSRQAKSVAGKQKRQCSFVPTLQLSIGGIHLCLLSKGSKTRVMEGCLHACVRDEILCKFTVHLKVFPTVDRPCRCRHRYPRSSSSVVASTRTLAGML